MERPFVLHTPYEARGDQPQAISSLVSGLRSGKQAQVLLGITGSGKTFTMANVISQLQRPALILAHNKTLAAQLYQEFKTFFPDNAVEYFVSYYDYYQPEAYIARTDTFIEKDMAINDRIDRLRLSASRSLLERRDVVIVASVSCIYGLGMPEYFRDMNVRLSVGDEVPRDELLLRLVEIQYTRNDIDFARTTFRVRGDVLEVFPSYEESLAYRIEFFGDEVERLSAIDPLTGRVIERLEKIVIYPGSHHVTPEEVRLNAIETIKTELEERIAEFDRQNKLVESQRIGQRTRYDLEMIREVGFCKGIENYSRHFGGRQPGEPPPCLLDYFPDDFIAFIDESHQTVPQLRAMYNGDRARKQSLIDFGFRLPSAYDNRPLRFEETCAKLGQVVYVSATPAEWELQESKGDVTQQIIRPTGLLDPIVEVRPASSQVDDVLEEIRQHTAKGGRVLVTTLTKRLSEELTKYLEELDVKAKYLHSDIDTVERMQIITDLRRGTFDVLVGINLLREGLDIPEVSLVAILDADREGFLRSRTSLIQTCGRAARNAEGRVIMYADKITDSIQETLDITQKRRELQNRHNLEHGIVPQTVLRDISPLVEEMQEERELQIRTTQVGKRKSVKEAAAEYLTLDQVRAKIADYDKQMRQAAKDLQFEEAAQLRDLMRHYQDLEIQMG